ncbi:MAG: potassium channel family protein, partial [Oscillospiraceae bacterium]
RIFKALHYSKNFLYISHVFRKEKKTLGSVLIIAVAYIFLSALAMFSYEPDTFHTFFDALYWATTALTTVGYGDVCPHTGIGRLISMISSLFGIAIIALPAGIITGGFVEEIQKGRESKAAPPIDAEKGKGDE